jgi:hypothetical protein
MRSGSMMRRVGRCVTVLGLFVIFFGGGGGRQGAATLETNGRWEFQSRE